MMETLWGTRQLPLWLHKRLMSLYRLVDATRTALVCCQLVLHLFSFMNNNYIKLYHLIS